MIEIIKELPDNVVGIVARGRVTNEGGDLRSACRITAKSGKSKSADPSEDPCERPLPARRAQPPHRLGMAPFPPDSAVRHRAKEWLLRGTKTRSRRAG
jgi:hypothetical protein